MIFLRNGTRGFTIVEALMAMGMIGMIMVVIMRMTYIGATSWKRQYTRMKLLRESQSAMYILAKNLREAKASTITISKGSNELDYSLISFNTVNQATLRFYYYQKSVLGAGGKLLGRQFIFVEPRLDAAGNTTYSQTVLATDVLNVCFTFPDANNQTKVLANLELLKRIDVNKDPVVVQTMEEIWVRNP